MKQTKNQNLSDSEKEKTYDKLVRTLDKKVKYKIKIVTIQITME